MPESLINDELFQSFSGMVFCVSQRKSEEREMNGYSDGQ